MKTRLPARRTEYLFQNWDCSDIDLLQAVGRALAVLSFVSGSGQEYLLHFALRTLLGQVGQVVKVGCEHGHRGEAILKVSWSCKE